MRRAMRHVGAVILTLAFCWGVGGAEATCRLDNPAALRAKAAASGGVRVIVGVQTPFQPEGNLASGPVAMQRGGIAAAQNQVLARLGEKLSGAPVTRFETIPYFATRVTAAALEALQKDPDVISVQEDRLDKADLQDSVPLIHAPEVWAAGYSGSGWAVAVLDTGVDSTHPFLAGKVLSEACYSTTDAGQDCQSACPGGASESTAPGSAMPPLGGSYGDAFYHGTHVAGIAAGHGASSSGVARSGDIIAVQVFSWFPNYDGLGAGRALSWTSDQILGLERIYALRNTHQIAAVNMSLGGGRYFSPCDGDSRKAIIDNLRSAGIATVISSGNNGYSDSTGAPGCISTAVTVGSTTKSDAVAYYSNSASFVDVLAPGSSINSSIPGGGFDSWDGTSMAAPHVAGAFAVLRSANPSFTVDQIEDALKSTGLPVSDSPRGAAPAAITKPRIRVKEAFDALMPTPTATPVPQPTATPVPQPTATPVPQPTATPVPQPTATPVPQPTATPVPQPTATPVPQPTATPEPQPTATPVPQPTATPEPQPTATPVPSVTPDPSATPAPTPVAPTDMPEPPVLPPEPTPVVQEGTPTGTPAPLAPNELPQTGGATQENVVISPDVVRQILGNQVSADVYQLVEVKNGEEKTFTTTTGYVILTVTSEISESGNAVYRWIMVIWNDVTKIWETVTGEIVTAGAALPAFEATAATLRSRMADGGPYDLDGVKNGTVQSRTAMALLAAPKTTPSPTSGPTGVPTGAPTVAPTASPWTSHSGGGCSTGLLPGALLLLVPFVFFLRR